MKSPLKKLMDLGALWPSETKRESLVQHQRPGRRTIIGHHRFVSKESRYKMSLTHLGLSHKVSKEAREKIRLHHLGKQYALGHKVSKEVRRRMSLAHLGLKVSRETREKIGIASKLNWQNPMYARRMIRSIVKGNFTRPTRPEERIINIIEDYNLPFTYNGNRGDFIIAGRCPDFVSNNGLKCIIEIFGNYWHGNNFPSKPSESQLTELYGKEEYKTLILWEEEIEESEDNYLAYLIIHLVIKAKKHNGQ